MEPQQTEAGKEIRNRKPKVKPNRREALAEIIALPPESLLYIWQAAMLRQVGLDTLKTMLDNGELEFRWVGRDRRIPKWLIIESDKKYIEDRNKRIEELQKR